MQEVGHKTIVRRSKQKDVDKFHNTDLPVTDKERFDLAKYEKKKFLTTRAEKLAGDKYCIRKWRWDEAASCFPREPWLRHVDKCFPYAEGGMLLIDEPDLPFQIEKSLKKKEVLQKLGYRFVVLMPGKTEADDYMELQKCGQQ